MLAEADPRAPQLLLDEAVAVEVEMIELRAQGSSLRAIAPDISHEGVAGILKARRAA